MFKVVVDYPGEQEEERILTLHSQMIDLNQRLATELKPMTSPEELLAISAANAQIRVEPKLVTYINQLVRQTRSGLRFTWVLRREPVWR